MAVNLSDGVNSDTIAALLAGLRTGVIWAESYASVAALKAADMTERSVGDRVWIDSYHSGLNLGGGGLVVVDTSIPGDDGHYFKPDTLDGNKTYVRIGVNPLHANITEFGCVPCNGNRVAVATQQLRFQAACDSLAAAISRGTAPTGWASGSNGFRASLYIPPGDDSTYPAMYPLNDTVTLPTVFGLKVYGGGILNMQTTDTNVLTFEPTDTGYPNNTLRQAIIADIHFFFETSGSDSGACIFMQKNPNATGTTNNITIEHCSCERGFRFLHGESAGYAQNITVNRCNFQNMRGAFVILEGAGNVKPVIMNSWVQSTVLQETCIILNSCFSPVIHDISFEAASGSSANPPRIKIASTNGAHIYDIRYEWGEPENGFEWLRTENSVNHTLVENVVFQNVTFPASGKSVYAFAVGGEIILRGFFMVQGCTYGASSEFALAGGFSTFGDAYWTSGAWKNEDNNSGSSTLKIASSITNYGTVTEGQPSNPPS